MFYNLRTWLTTFIQSVKTTLDRVATCMFASVYMSLTYPCELVFP